MEDIKTTKALKYTKELTILYIEDDKELQAQTVVLLEDLFKSVSIANDGKEGLSKYMSNHYDIVMSDIRMPGIDGVELCQKIKEINANQSIVIISAHNENTYLIELINLSVNQFILKPVEANLLVNTLYEVSKNIVNAKMVESYRKELESTNMSLKEKNDELQSLVRILDSKLAQLSSVTPSTKSLDTDIEKLSDEHLNELKELETDISGASVLISLTKNIDVANIQILGTMFRSYAEVLAEYSDYFELKEKVDLLAESLDKAPENFIKRVDDISILLESFIYVLRMWRKNLVEDEVKKAFELHTSMLNDISTIISIIDGTENDIETEMEFF